MEYKIEIVEQIKKAIQQNELLYIPSSFKHELNWSHFIEALDYKFNNTSVLHFHREQLKKAEDSLPIVIYNKLDPVIFDLFTSRRNITTINDMPSINSFSKFAQSVFDNYERVAIKAIMNFVGNEAEYHVHKDREEVLALGCIGAVEWRIYNNVPDKYLDKFHREELPYTSILLNPGDLLYVPKGLVHSVVITEPRASLIVQAI